LTEQEYHFNEGMLQAYDNMNRTISGAIKRNGGATTALQIINVFNELTSSLHYNLSLTKDKLSEWQERDGSYEVPQEPKGYTGVFGEEIEMLEVLLHHLATASNKGGN
jgi:hypothetical protein